MLYPEPTRGLLTFGRIFSSSIILKFPPIKMGSENTDIPWILFINTTAEVYNFVGGDFTFFPLYCGIFKSVFAFFQLSRVSMLQNHLEYFFFTVLHRVTWLIKFGGGFAKIPIKRQSDTSPIHDISVHNSCSTDPCKKDTKSFSTIIYFCLISFLLVWQYCSILILSQAY